MALPSPTSDTRRLLIQRESLRGAIESFSSELELHPLLGLIVRQACALLEAEHGSIGLYDEETQTMEIVAEHGLPTGELGRRQGPGRRPRRHGDRPARAGGARDVRERAEPGLARARPGRRGGGAHPVGGAAARLLRPGRHRTPALRRAGRGDADAARPPRGHRDRERAALPVGAAPHRAPGPDRAHRPHHHRRPGARRPARPRGRGHPRAARLPERGHPARAPARPGHAGGARARRPVPAPRSGTRTGCPSRPASWAPPCARGASSS